MRINFYGGPGCGKSTLASKVFADLKARSFSIELVQEYIKTWAYLKRVPKSFDQVYIFGQQLHAEDLVHQSGILHLVTDSPLYMQPFYSKIYNFPAWTELMMIAKQYEKTHSSLNIFLDRSVTYQQNGRYETVEQAIDRDVKMKQFLEEQCIPFVSFKPTDYDAILGYIELNLASPDLTAEENVKKELKRRKRKPRREPQVEDYGVQLLMTCKIIDGKAISNKIREELAIRVGDFRRRSGIQPRLGVILVGDNPASHIYVEKKQQACGEVGIASDVIYILEGAPFVVLEDAILELNKSKKHHGILVQLPLPKAVESHRVFELIAPEKDVDVFNPYNVGLLVQGRPSFQPCTPHAIQQLLVRSGIPIARQHVVVINRSDVVGKPLSSMLIQDNDDFANATVTVCHNHTHPAMLEKITKMASIVVVAVGKPGFLTGKMIQPGAVVVDVGINRVGGKIVGDADVSCREIAGWITPVPGGVGPMTVTMLLENTLHAALATEKL